MPTYNRPDFLRILLRSLPEDLPVVVSDNGARLTTDFMSEFPGVQFRPTSQVLAPLANWNTAIRAQTTEWIAIPGDDDVYDAGAFTVVQREVERNQAADLIIFGHRIIDEHGNGVSTWSPPPGFFLPPQGFRKFRFGIDARMPSIFFRRSLYEALNGFDERFLVTAGDSDFLQRAALIGRCVFVPDVISRYRIWQGGTTSQLIATEGWMNDVDLWCDTVQRFDAMHGTGEYSRRIRDEIFLRNLIGGLAAIAGHNDRFSRLRYLRRFAFPRHAQLRSYLQLAKVLLS